MPYLFFKCACSSERFRTLLIRYLALSGINLCGQFRMRPDAVGLVLSHGTASVRYAPAASRFACCVGASVRSVFPAAAARQDRSLSRFPVPTISACVPDSLDDDACARIVSDAVQRYFLLPALPDRPELPAKIADRAAKLYTVPDACSRVLRVLPADQSVSLLGTSGAWSIVRAGGELGFCRAENVRAY